eukprot:GHUV01030901.1.p1 GENE.GHUV01030901.1~~GHUV01030901.1.p1  ORF type:complete len:422 (+),score=72.83 GHUV01030901.1:42-1307(+)
MYQHIFCAHKQAPALAQTEELLLQLLSFCVWQMQSYAGQHSSIFPAGPYADLQVLCRYFVLSIARQCGSSRLLHCLLELATASIHSPSALLQDRCPVWANDGECSKNLDYMMISCKQSCNNCKIYSTNKPFRVAQLNSGYKMPTVGFGTAGLTVGTAAAVQFAVAAGYRMFDSAESPDWYDEAQVGAGLAASKVPRDQLFLMSKIHPRDFGHAATLAAVKRSLGHYNTSYLDMLLLHYPSCTPGTQCVPQPERTWQQSWKTLEELVNAQLVRSIGVSNFDLSEMQELLKLAKTKPSVLQSRSDPFAVNHHLINFCIEHNIMFVGYSTLGTQWINSPVAVNPVHNNKLLKEISKAHPGKSVGQVVLRWALQRGQIIIPRSSSTTHIPENLQLFDFELSDSEMQAISTLDGTWKTGGLPLPVA